MKIFFSNAGYLRGINGTLRHHFLLGYRYLYTSRRAQMKSLQQLREILEEHDPDLGCLVEIDRGSANSSYFNQMEHLIDDRYTCFAVDSKYGIDGQWRQNPISIGKSNAFFSKREVAFAKRYMEHGAKRLVYEITLPEFTLFFTHFSLKRDVRARQFHQLGTWMRNCQSPAILLGDFNIFGGVNELLPLLHDSDFRVLNDMLKPTHTFSRRTRALDLCICSQSLLDRVELAIIPQHFSDHHALLLQIH